MSIPLFFGPYGSAALEQIAKFDAYGANTIWFHGFDPTAFDACAKFQIAPCVEFKTFRADFAKHPELIPIGVDGKPIRYGRLVQGVCLSNEAFLQETEDNLIAGLRAFEPAGIWLDYLTYAGWFETPEPDLQESCFCGNCVAEFCASTGIDATSPDEILTHYAQAWTRHKCERIAGFADHYANLIRKHRPGCLVGAYMCPWMPGEYDGALGRIFAQDYALLAPSIDIFTPLIYAQKSGRPAGWGRAFLEQAGELGRGRKIQLILDVLDLPESLVETAASAQPSYGLQIFGGAQVLADPEQATILAQAVAQIQQRIAGY